MRRKSCWAVLAVLLVLIGACAFWWGLRGQELLSGLKDRVAAELARTFGVKVTMKGAELTAWNVVTLDDIFIYDAQGRTVAKLPLTEVEIDPLRLLWTGKVVESIGRVAVVRPELSLYKDRAGKWNVDELLKQDLPENREFKGKLTLADGQVFIHDQGQQRRIAPLAGSLDFAGNPAVKFRLTLREQAKRARLYGTFTPQGQGVATLQGENQDMESWQAFLPADWSLADLRGTVASLELTLERKAEGLKFAGEVKPAGVSGRVAGVAIEDVQGFIVFSDAEIRLYYTAGKIEGQLLALRGKIRRPLTEPELDLQVLAQAIDLAALNGKAPLGGTLSLDAHLSGGWRHVRAAGKLWLANGRLGAYSFALAETGIAVAQSGTDWSLEIQNGNGTLAGEPLSLLSGRVHSRSKLLTMEAVSFRLGEGLLAASGLLGPEQLGLKLTAANVPLAAFARSHPALLISGRGDFAGALSGSPAAVNLEGDFRTLDGKIFHQPFTHAAGHLKLENGILALSGVEMRNGKAWHRIDGQLALTGNRALNLRVRTEGARAEDLVALLAPGEALTGNIANDVVLGGTLDDVEADGTMTLTEGSYRGFLLSKAGGAYRRQGGVVSLQDFTVDSFNARVALSGTLDRQGRLDFSVAARDVEAAYIQINYPYPVQGKISLSGHLGGSTQAPELRGEVFSRTLKLNGQELFDISGSVAVSKAELDVPSLQFLLGSGLVRFNGGYREKDGGVYGALSVENADVGGLLTILNTPVKNVAGRLSGQVALSGTAASPALQVAGTLSAGRIKGYPLDSIDVDISLRNHVVTINDFRAKQGSGMVVAKGTADMNGPLALEVAGRDVDAGLLAAWLDTTAEVQGKMNFVAQVGGTAKSPAGGLSLEIRKGGVTNATFDELFGLFLLKDDVIHVDQLFITKGEHRASLYGDLPFKALSRQGLSQGGTADSMNLRLRLDQANLSILAMLSPEVEWAAGPTRGEILIGGTLAKPVYTGSLSVTDGTVKLKSLADPLTQLGVAIRFEDDKMLVERISGSLGGGTFQLEGFATLNGQQGLADYHGKLVLDKLGIRHKYLHGPLNGALEVARINGTPTLSGKLLFENMTFNIPTLPDLPASSLDLAMDLDMTAGRNLRAYSPSLYDIWLDGGFHIGGTLRRPRITGKINLARGSVDYLGTRFRIEGGSVDFPTPRSLDPRVHLEASTNLSSTKVWLAIDGPASGMDLKLTSIPALSPQEIRTVLAFRPRSGDALPTGAVNSDMLAREEMRALLTTGLRMQMLGEMENSFRNTFGLDDFRLTSNTRSSSREPVVYGSSVAAGKPASLEEVYTVEMSKYIGDKVAVTWALGLNRSEYLVEARYDVTKSISINASVDEKNGSRIGAQFRIRF